MNTSYMNTPAANPPSGKRASTSRISPGSPRDALAGLTTITNRLLAAGFASGVLLIADSVVLDVALEGSTAARAAGVIVAPLALLGVIGLYLAVRRRRECIHLDAGLILNVIALCAVSALAFSRNFILEPIDATTLDIIKDSTPVVSGLITAGSLAGIGFVAFGTALIRHGCARVPSVLYTILLPASGFAAQMPVAASALVQGLAGIAVIWLTVSERARLTSNSSPRA